MLANAYAHADVARAAVHRSLKRGTTERSDSRLDTPIADEPC